MADLDQLTTVSILNTSLHDPHWQLPSFLVLSDVSAPPAVASKGLARWVG